MGQPKMSVQQRLETDQEDYLRFEASQDEELFETLLLKELSRTSEPIEED